MKQPPPKKMSEAQQRAFTARTSRAIQGENLHNGYHALAEDPDAQTDYIMEHMDEFYEYYADSMPYGVMKARTGDPVDWIINQLEGS